MITHLNVSQNARCTLRRRDEKDVPYLLTKKRNLRFQAPVQPSYHAVGLADCAVGDNLARRINRARHPAGRGGRLSARSLQSARGDRLLVDEGRGGAGEE